LAGHGVLVDVAHHSKNHCAPGQTPPGVCQMVLAVFDLAPVTSTSGPNPPPGPNQYPNVNRNMFNTDKNQNSWFTNALTNFPTDFGQGSRTNPLSADTLHHFPWSKTTVSEVVWNVQPTTSTLNLYTLAQSNPFLGQFSFMPPGGDPCVVNLTGTQGCTPEIRRADHFLYPRQCTLADLAATDPSVTRLRACGANMMGRRSKR
jgi:hypothetical protein